MASKSFELGGSDFDWLLVEWLCKKIDKKVEEVKEKKMLYQCIVKKVEELKTSFNTDGVDDVDIELDYVDDNSNSDEDDEDDILRIEYDEFCEQLQSVVDRFCAETADFIRNLPPLSRCEITGSGIRNRRLQAELLQMIKENNHNIISFVVPIVVVVPVVVVVPIVVVFIAVVVVVFIVAAHIAIIMIIIFLYSTLH